MSDELAENMIPVARRLIGAVQKIRSREAVERVIATIPDERAKDALLVVLAAMVEPDGRPEELLAWTETLADQESPQAREQRRLESLGVPLVTAQLCAARAAAQDPALAGWSPPVRAEKAGARDNTRRRDRERKREQREVPAAEPAPLRDRMLLVIHGKKASV